MANRRFNQFFYTLEKKPILLSCNFVVDVNNGNGLGLRSLKGPGIANVFMNSGASMTGTVTNLSFNITAIADGTSSLVIGMPVQGTGIPAGTTISAILSSSSVSMSQAATGTHASESITYQAPGSPNPAAGIIMIQLQDCYNKYLGGFSGFVSPVGTSTKIDNSALTPGNPYVIVTAGNSSLATWQGVGLPVGITPSVGAAFVATSAGGSANTSTSRVMIPGASGISSIEVVGDANQTIISNAGSQAVILGQASGAYLIAQCLAPTNSSSAMDFPFIATAPAPGSVIGMSFYLSSSSINVQGE